MSLINKNNYEAFLLDYMEQNLSADMVAELMLFFENNPELKSELEELEGATLLSEEIVFTDKDELKKGGLDNLMIAEIEGLNSDDDSKQLETAIQEEEENEKTFLLYQKTILKPTPIIFADKGSLKRERKIIPLYWWATSAAAIFLAFFFIQTLNTEGIKETTTEFSDNKGVEVKAIDSVLKEKPLIIEEELHDNNAIQVAEEVIKTSPKQQQKEKKKDAEVIEELELNDNVLVAQEDPIIEKDSITILPPVFEDEVLLAENNAQKRETQKDDVLSVGQFLKKEAQKKVLKEEDPKANKKAEVMVADLLAKVAGKNGSVDKTTNDEDEVEEYALNIGGFSFSKKVRK